MIHWKQKIMPHNSQVTSGNNLENMCNISRRKRRCKKEYSQSVNSHEGLITHPYGNTELATLYIYIFTLGEEKVRKTHMQHYLVNV